MLFICRNLRFWFFFFPGEYIWVAICNQRTWGNWIRGRNLSWTDPVAGWISIQASFIYVVDSKISVSMSELILSCYYLLFDCAVHSFNLHSFQPNGRFETQTKICLSISNHHPEHWQPSWSGKFRSSRGMFDVCVKLWPEI